MQALSDSQDSIRIGFMTTQRGWLQDLLNRIPGDECNDSVSIDELIAPKGASRLFSSTAPIFPVRKKGKAWNESTLGPKHLMKRCALFGS